MRLFVAIDISDEIRKKLEGIQEDIAQTGTDIKFVEPENLHLTLKFLGEVDEDKVIEVVNMLFECLKGVKQFKIGMDGVGFFGNENYVRTIWIGLKEGREEMIRIMEILDKNLNYIRKEEHKPSAHLTIGRVKGPSNRELLLKKLEELKDIKIGETVVKEVKLVQSQLTKKGPIYSDFKVFPLE